jgi:hypothetical protein
LAINGPQTRLYGANTLLGSIDVYDCFFKPVSLASGAFIAAADAEGSNVKETAG